MVKRKAGDDATPAAIDADMGQGPSPPRPVWVGGRCFHDLGGVLFNEVVLNILAPSRDARESDPPAPMPAGIDADMGQDPGPSPGRPVWFGGRCFRNLGGGVVNELVLDILGPCRHARQSGPPAPMPAPSKSPSLEDNVLVKTPSFTDDVYDPSPWTPPDDDPPDAMMQ